MDVALTEDQELFRETTRKFLEAECPVPQVRKLHEDDVALDAKYWRQGAELGWTSALVSEEDGGGSVSGNGLLDLVLVAEEMGRLVSPGPLLPVSVVAETLSRRGSAEQKADVLGALLGGDEVATWAFAEPGRAWSAEGVGLTATAVDGGFRLEGTKTAVQDAGVARWFLVTARTEGGLTQLLVPADTAGVTVSPLGSLDLVRRFASVTFDGAVVPASAVVGEVGGAAADVERQLQIALVLQVAEMVGAVDRVLEFTLEYANDRIAFGRPIGSYQALKHRFADMRTWLEAMHATANAAAKAVQSESADAADLVSVAKAYVADRGPAIIQDCVQLHGGIGVTWEHDLHVYLRRVTQDAALFGSVSHHRELLAAAIGM